MVSSFLIAMGCRSEEASEVWELKIYFLTSALAVYGIMTLVCRIKRLFFFILFLIEQLRSMGKIKWIKKAKGRQNRMVVSLVHTFH